MEIFKCEVCGNVVDLLFNGGGTLVCCGQDMTKMIVNQDETVYEKHIPVLEINDNEIKVQVGEVLHPTEEKHYIEWIAMITSKGVIRKNFQPGESPVMTFSKIDEDFNIYAYCNIHGLFQGKVK